MVVPWPPGGVTDVLARGLAASLSESLGQQVVIDNRPGAAGTLGVGIVAKAPAAHKNRDSGCLHYQMNNIHPADAHQRQLPSGHRGANNMQWQCQRCQRR